MMEYSFNNRGKYEYYRGQYVRCPSFNYLLLMPPAAHMGPAVFLLFLTLVECNREATVAFLFMAVTLQGALYSGFAVNHVDISPNFAGTLYGITNAFGTIPGWLAPLTVGALTNGRVRHRVNVYLYYTSSQHLAKPREYCVKLRGVGYTSLFLHTRQYWSLYHIFYNSFSLTHIFFFSLSLYSKHSPNGAKFSSLPRPSSPSTPSSSSSSRLGRCRTGTTYKTTNHTTPRTRRSRSSRRRRRRRRGLVVSSRQERGKRGVQGSWSPPAVRPTLIRPS